MYIHIYIYIYICIYIYIYTARSTGGWPPKRWLDVIYTYIYIYIYIYISSRSIRGHAATTLGYARVLVDQDALSVGICGFWLRSRWIHALTHTHTHTHMRVRIHKPMHTHTHTHTHTRDADVLIFQHVSSVYF